MIEYCAFIFLSLANHYVGRYTRLNIFLAHPNRAFVHWSTLSPFGLVLLLHLLQPSNSGTRLQFRHPTPILAPRSNWARL